jgi:hypothetical protein
MGAPEKFKKVDVEEALKKSRGMVSPAARRLGCEPNTIRNYAARYPSVQQVMDEQRDQFLDESEIQLIGAVNRSEPWAISFALRTVGRKRGYVERSEHEVTGKDGGAIEIVTEVTLSIGAIDGESTTEGGR